MRIQMPLRNFLKVNIVLNKGKEGFIKHDYTKIIDREKSNKNNKQILCNNSEFLILYHDYCNLFASRLRYIYQACKGLLYLQQR